jgi:hypothetical protein
MISSDEDNTRDRRNKQTIASLRKKANKKETMLYSLFREVPKEIIQKQCKYL